MSKNVTPAYSAFALVAIESIWPSTRGDEVPVNFRDLTLLNERIGEQSEREESGENAQLEENRELVKEKVEELNKVGTLSLNDFNAETSTRAATEGEAVEETELRQKAQVLLDSLVNKDPLQTDYQFSYKNEDDETVTVTDGDSLKAFKFREVSRGLVTDASASNFDARYYNTTLLSEGSREVLNKFFSSLASPSATGIRVTEFIGTYKNSRNTHRGFDIVIDPSGDKDRTNLGAGRNLQKILAPFDGEVVFAGIRSNDGIASNNYGYSVGIKPSGSENVAVVFSHMSRNLSVSVGQRVKKGDDLGEQDNSGRSFGNHIHVEVITNYSVSTNVSTNGGVISGNIIKDANQFANILGNYVSTSTVPTPRNFSEIYANNGKDEDSDRDRIMTLVYNALVGDGTIPEVNLEDIRIPQINFSYTPISIPGGQVSEIYRVKNKLESLKTKFESGEYSILSLLRSYNVVDINFTPSIGDRGDVEKFVRDNLSAYLVEINTSLETIDLFLNENADLVNEIQDLESSIRESERSQFGSGYALYPQSDVRPSFSSVLTKEDAYKKRKGYFKIIPLNIVQVSTNSSTGSNVGQSTFNISFTLDDVIIVADEYGKKGIFDTISSTALPITIDSVFDEVYKLFGGEIPETLRKELVPFGFSAYRISGSNFTFNIEDIVEANDTVSIWLYHDPKEFDFIEEEYGEQKFLDGSQRPALVKEAEEVASEINDVNKSYRLFPKYTAVEEVFSFISDSDARALNFTKIETAVEVDGDFVENVTKIQDENKRILSQVDNLLTLFINLNNDLSNGIDPDGKLPDVLNFKSTTGRILGDKTDDLSICSPESLANSAEEARLLNRYHLYTRRLDLCNGRSSNLSSTPNSKLQESIELLKNLKLNLSGDINIIDNFLNSGEVVSDEVEEILPDDLLPGTDGAENNNILTPQEYNSILNKRTFSYVIGSGSRRSQDDFKFIQEDEITYKSRGSAVDSVLFDSGVLSKYLNPETVQRLIDGEEEISLSPEEVFNILLQFGREVDLSGFNSNLTGLTTDQNLSRLEYLAGIVFPGQSDGPLRNSFFTVVKEIFLADFDEFNRRLEEDERTFGIEIEPVRANPERYKSAFAGFSKSILDILIAYPNAEIETQVSNWLSNSPTYLYNDQVFYLSALYSAGTIKEIFEFIETFTPHAERIIYDAVEFISGEKPTLVVTPGETGKGFFNKRKMFITRSHGETPYLVLKGHIANIEAKYGASNGSHMITLNGNGYEKILNDNIVYFEDLYLPGGSTLPKYVDANTIYSNILPPVALLSFIETHVPRFIIAGEKSATAKNTNDFGLYFFRDIAKQLRDEANGKGLNTDNLPEPADIDFPFVPPDSVLVRGRALFQYTLIRGNGREPMFRVYYPINYLNTSRIAEMISIIQSTNSEKDGIISIPVKITSGQNVSSNLINLNGPKEIHHLFVDETGRLKQKLSFEAWEKTPRPEYMPTIMDSDVLATGATFSRDSGNLHTMVDVVPSYLANTGRGVASALYNGRTLSRGNDYIPILSSGIIDYLNVNDSLYSNFYEAISEGFFRYGLRYKRFTDHYSPSETLAERKSILYHQFFHKPIKTAKISVKGNPSYRAGETVLTYLDTYKYRSKEIIDLNKTLDWLKYIRRDEVLTKMYVGVDERWINEDSYYLTTDLVNSPEYSYWLADYKKDPYQFILSKIIATLTYIKSRLGGFTNTDNEFLGDDRSLYYITPDYFPTTYWAFSQTVGGTNIAGRISPGLVNSDVITAYNEIYDVLTQKTDQMKTLNTIFSKNPGLINAIRMQNFRATSYYIDSVQHSFLHGQNFTTTLSLTHGQDNLVIIEPYTMRPIGFISLEKKMRIGYDDAAINPNGELVFPNEPNRNSLDRALWENFDSKELSYIQKVYIEQFKQDAAFKEDVSFLYQSQKYRNSSNFLYELSLNLGININV
jgi:murein DD-endopeptidase MepM/ murein hydrolase activator NlpD